MVRSPTLLEAIELRSKVSVKPQKVDARHLWYLSCNLRGLGKLESRQSTTSKFRICIMMKEEVLANLGYFMEWGGRSWENLCRHALQNLGDLRGKTVLEIGPRFGKMSACFALLGA